MTPAATLMHRGVYVDGDVCDRAAPFRWRTSCGRLVGRERAMSANWDHELALVTCPRCLEVTRQTTLEIRLMWRRA